MAKKKTINATAEYGVGVKTSYDNKFIAEFDSERHKVKITIDDSQIAALAYDLHEHLKRRQKDLDNLKAILKGE